MRERFNIPRTVHADSRLSRPLPSGTPSPFGTRGGTSRGSGLIIVLAVLAMLAVMATSFVTLMRIETRITTNYVDDQRCEMLVQGVLRYVSGILREDQDRSWGRYENRDMACGITNGPNAWGAGGANVPGIEGAPWGTPPSNDVWYSAPKAENWGNWGGLYDVDTAYGVIPQESFVWNDYYNRQHGIPGRYERLIGGEWVEADTFIDRTRNWWGTDAGGRVIMVDSAYRSRTAPIDDDGDGDPNSTTGDLGYGWDWYSSPYGREQNADWGWYWDASASVIYSGNQFMFPGRPLTRDAMVLNGIYWRWSLNLGYGHSMYVNLNTAGNVFKDNAYLASLGRVGLQAKTSYEDRAVAGQHLSRLEWKGFAGEYNCDKTGGFPDYYDAVAWHPSHVNLERLFYRPPPFTDGPIRNVGVDSARARDLILRRWGPDGKPADGDDRFCAGWRRDGATYYKFDSPENPLGNDRYFGVTEALEHDHASYHTGESALAAVLSPVEQSTLRPFITCWSTDTILRGKIWPTEGWLPWRTSGTAGDWRHIDILKRVNINIVGAGGPEGLPGEDATLKNRWVAKRQRERDRLYFMLVHAMTFTGTAGRQQKACQFIASLADMIDRGNDETLYVAPDGSGAWALGVEKFPVINEIACALDTGANTPTYNMFRFRMELYNPAENIPWIPDPDEACEVKDYVVRLGSVNFLVGDLSRFSALNLNDDNWGAGLAGLQIKNLPDKFRKIGADGIFGTVIPGFPTGQTDAVWGDPTWTRYVHLGWKHASVSNGNWPTGLTQAILEGPGQAGIEISLWKPLAGDAAGLATSLGKVEDITVPGVGTRRYLCVDTTGTIRLIQPYGGATGLTGPGGTRTSYVGNYRRWDPMNAKVYDGGNYGKVDSGNVIWCPGWLMAGYSTLGRPNVSYKSSAYTNPSSFGISPYQYTRAWERNFKVMDGDLPSIGWFGELIMRNPAQDGPLTLVHAAGQNPTAGSATASQLDAVAKFDLFKPFGDVKHLHVLDTVTVWDPSNDGIDNDGDGAVDDDDTGLQAGDKGGPEVRVFGRLDLNYASHAAFQAAFPDLSSKDSRWDWRINKQAPNAGIANGGSRQSERGGGGGEYGGVFETIGDLLRTDGLSSHPGSHMGFLGAAGNVDDDGDGITNERDERDMIFNWVSNYFTTRANVFEVNVTADLCTPPYHPGRVLPMVASKTARVLARKQMVGVVDRSSTLRVRPDGGCDFTGSVQFRVTRFTDDARVY